jgi:hypothetical protein
MNDEIYFVTNDSAMQGKKKKTVMSKTDYEILKSVRTGKGMITLKPGDLQKLAEAAAKTFDECRKMAEPMTKEQAEIVRTLRVEKGYSWRAVAQACYDLGWGPWQPPSNQIVGIALCKRAAKYFKEEYMKSPWN